MSQPYIIASAILVTRILLDTLARHDPDHPPTEPRRQSAGWPLSRGDGRTSKAYVARRHLAMPASTDYWINDRSGDPLLVITGETNAALTKALPRLLREVRDVVGERRVTIVFDRGGWSPKLFDTIIKDGSVLPPRPMPSSAARPCAASRSPMASSASSCAWSAIAWRSYVRNAKTFPRASKSATLTSGPWSARHGA
jgi:hypothetical protein